MDRDVAPFIRVFGRYLRDLGLPVTQQREAVAQVVFGSEGHQSVEEIEAVLRERGERIGKATIYRTLDLLVRSRLVEERVATRHQHAIDEATFHETRQHRRLVHACADRADHTLVAQTAQGSERARNGLGLVRVGVMHVEDVDPVEPESVQAVVERTQGTIERETFKSRPIPKF